MTNKKVFVSLLLLLIIGFGFYSTTKVSAQSNIIPKASGRSACSDEPGKTADDCGDYAVSDFIALAINISQWILGIVGSLTLLMFVYGGFTFLISAGSSEKVGQAKKIITAAVIGLIIIFASWLIINYVFQIMGLDWQGDSEKKPGQLTETVKTETNIK